MVPSVKDHLVTLLRVSNTANLPTKPDQVAEAGRLESMERKPKSSIKFSTLQKPKRKQNKVKTSLLT